MQISVQFMKAFTRTTMSEDDLEIQLTCLPKDNPTRFEFEITGGEHEWDSVEFHRGVHDIDILIKLLEETKHRMLQAGYTQ